MAAHARLKNEFSKDEKSHNLMIWLISSLLLLKSEKMDLTDKYIGFARILTGLKYGQKATALYHSRLNN